MYYQDQDKVKRNKILGARNEDNPRYDASHQNIGEKLAPESCSHTSTAVNRPVLNTITTARAPSSSINGLKQSLNDLKQDKVKGGSSNPRDNVKVADGVIRKSIKRKAELQPEGPHFRPKKLVSSRGEEKPKVLKQSTLVSNFQPTSIPSLGQSS